MTMRIAQVIDSLKIGGAQRLQCTFAEGARARNLDVTFVSLQESPASPIPDELRSSGFRVLTLPSRKLLDFARIKKLSRLLKEEQIDVVQTHLSSGNIVGTLAAAYSHIPVIATLHTAGKDPRHQNKARRVLESFLLRTVSARVVAVGHVVAEANRKRLLGKQIDVVSNAVTTVPVLAESERLAIRSQLTGDPNRPIFISVGRLSPPKGFADLLDAFAMVRNAHPDCTLFIAGDGICRQDLESQIRRLRLDRDAVILGFRDDVPKLLAASDIYVCSSHWEGLPVSILEAMASGLPVVSTSVGDIPHVVQQNAGLLVHARDSQNLANAMTELLTDRIKRQQMGKCARQLVEQHYTLQPWMDKILSLYSEIRYSSMPLAQEV